ncbi:MAG: hypothetical protein E7Y34_02920 [Mycoplasma sp.]|nr:hypothetical protein [Mycoplasma sp.]
MSKTISNSGAAKGSTKRKHVSMSIKQKVELLQKMDKGISFVSLIIPKSVYQFHAALQGGRERCSTQWTGSWSVSTILIFRADVFILFGL